jgi:hypothetical protein
VGSAEQDNNKQIFVIGAVFLFYLIPYLQTTFKAKHNSHHYTLAFFKHTKQYHSQDDRQGNLHPPELRGLGKLLGDLQPDHEA